MQSKHSLTDDTISERFADTRDTLCYATNDNQSAVYGMLNIDADFAIVVGGYNSSNTSHLVELCEEKLPTYFVLNASRLISDQEIMHYNLHERREVVAHNWLPEGPVVVGITAGASCPNNLIEETLIRLFDLRGIGVEQLHASTD